MYDMNSGQVNYVSGVWYLVSERCFFQGDVVIPIDDQNKGYDTQLMELEKLMERNKLYAKVFGMVGLMLLINAVEIAIVCFYIRHLYLIRMMFCGSDILRSVNQ